MATLQPENEKVSSLIKVRGGNLALTQVSRNSSGYLTPRRKTRFRKFPWKSDPLRETVQTVPPRLTPRDPSEPTDAPENERKFAISGAKKSQSLKNRALCAAKKIPNPTHIGIEPPTTSKSEDLAKMTYSIPDFLSRGRKKAQLSRKFPWLSEGLELEMVSRYLTLSQQKPGS